MPSLLREPAVQGGAAFFYRLCLEGVGTSRSTKLEQPKTFPSCDLAPLARPTFLHSPGLRQPTHTKMSKSTQKDRASVFLPSVFLNVYAVRPGCSANKGCQSFRNEKPAQRPKFSAGRPCGHPAKNFGQALQILENKNKHFGTDMPRGRPRKNFGLKNFGLIFRSLELTGKRIGLTLA